MTLEQAVKIIQQVFITKQGLSPDDCILAAQAWQTIVNLVIETNKQKEKNNESV